MFISKKLLRIILDSFTILEKKVDAIASLYKGNPQTIDCAACGCMVKKSLATEGESRIEKETHTIWSTLVLTGNKCIVTPYYCKRCAPKPALQKSERKLI